MTSARRRTHRCVSPRHLAYLQQLPADEAEKADALDDLLDFILSGETMTWSLLYLVQGRKPLIG